MKSVRKIFRISKKNSFGKGKLGKSTTIRDVEKPGSTSTSASSNGSVQKKNNNNVYVKKQNNINNPIGSEELTERDDSLSLNNLELSPESAELVVLMSASLKTNIKNKNNNDNEDPLLSPLPFQEDEEEDSNNNNSNEQVVTKTKEHQPPRSSTSSSASSSPPSSATPVSPSVRPKVQLRGGTKSPTATRSPRSTSRRQRVVVERPSRNSLSTSVRLEDIEEGSVMTGEECLGKEASPAAPQGSSSQTSSTSSSSSQRQLRSHNGQEEEEDEEGSMQNSFALLIMGRALSDWEDDENETEVMVEKDNVEQKNLEEVEVQTTPSLSSILSSERPQQGSCGSSSRGDDDLPSLVSYPSEEEEEDSDSHKGDSDSREEDMEEAEEEEESSTHTPTAPIAVATTTTTTTTEPLNYQRDTLPIQPTRRTSSAPQPFSSSWPARTISTQQRSVSEDERSMKQSLSPPTLGTAATGPQEKTVKKEEEEEDEVSRFSSTMEGDDEEGASVATFASSVASSTATPSSSLSKSSKTKKKMKKKKTASNGSRETSTTRAEVTEEGYTPPATKNQSLSQYILGTVSSPPSSYAKPTKGGDEITDCTEDEWSCSEASHTVDEDVSVSTFASSVASSPLTPSSSSHKSKKELPSSSKSQTATSSSCSSVGGDGSNSSKKKTKKKNKSRASLSTSHDRDDENSDKSTTLIHAMIRPWSSTNDLLRGCNDVAQNGSTSTTNTPRSAPVTPTNSMNDGKKKLTALDVPKKQRRRMTVSTPLDDQDETSLNVNKKKKSSSRTSSGDMASVSAQSGSMGEDDTSQQKRPSTSSGSKKKKKKATPKKAAKRPSSLRGFDQSDLSGLDEASKKKWSSTGNLLQDHDDDQLSDIRAPRQQDSSKKATKRSSTAPRDVDQKDHQELPPIDETKRSRSCTGALDDISPEIEGSFSPPAFPASGSNTALKKRNSTGKKLVKKVTKRASSVRQLERSELGGLPTIDESRRLWRSTGDLDNGSIRKSTSTTKGDSKKKKNPTSKGNARVPKRRTSKKLVAVNEEGEENAVDSGVVEPHDAAVFDSQIAKKLHEASSQLLSQAESISSLENELENCKHVAEVEVASAKKECDKVQQKFFALQTETRILLSDNIDLGLELHSTQRELEEKLREHDALKQSLEEIESQEAKADSVRVYLEDAQRVIAMLEQENSSLQKLNNDLNENLKTVFLMQKDAAEWKEEKVALESHVTELREQLRGLSEEHSAQLSEKERAIARLQQELSQLGSRIRRLNATECGPKDLGQEPIEQNNFVQLSGIEQAFETLRKQLSERDVKIQQLNEEGSEKRAKLNKQVHDMTQRNTDLQEKLYEEQVQERMTEIETLRMNLYVAQKKVDGFQNGNERPLKIGSDKRHEKNEAQVDGDKPKASANKLTVQSMVPDMNHGTIASLRFELAETKKEIEEMKKDLDVVTEEILLKYEECNQLKKVVAVRDLRIENLEEDLRRQKTDSQQQPVRNSAMPDPGVQGKLVIAITKLQRQLADRDIKIERMEKEATGKEAELTDQVDLLTNENLALLANISFQGSVISALRQEESRNLHGQETVPTDKSIQGELSQKDATIKSLNEIIVKIKTENLALKKENLALHAKVTSEHQVTDARTKDGTTDSLGSESKLKGGLHQETSELTNGHISSPEAVKKQDVIESQRSEDAISNLQNELEEYKNKALQMMKENAALINDRKAYEAEMMAAAVHHNAALQKISRLEMEVRLLQSANDTLEIECGNVGNHSHGARRRSCQTF